MRVGGQIIWASDFSESTQTSGGGKGAPSGPKTTTYSYSVNLAVALCAGALPPAPVEPRNGEAPSLRSLDDDGNLVATIGMDAYYATLAESWFGVPAADVLPGSVAPLEGIVRAA